jgi:peptidoglycan/xylan/chitin deacetylase (PgdA/CDA1 family)
MKSTLNNLLQVISRLIPLRLYPRLVQREVISIFYHAVSDGVMAHVRYLYPLVSVADFMSALGYLQKNYTLVSYDQLQDHYKKKTPLPPDALHLSFDDGFAECYTVVRPLLLDMGIPCTFFLTIDWLDNRMLYFRHAISLCVHQVSRLERAIQIEFVATINRQFNLSLRDIAGFIAWIMAFRGPEGRILDQVCTLLGIEVERFLAEQTPYLTTAQVKQMHADGFTIGAHGLSHRKLGFVPDGEIEAEIVGSCQAVQAITGRSVVPFSFPQSAGNVDRAQLADILERHPLVGLLFDTKDLMLDEAFIYNRVWAERPLTPARLLHPLPEVLVHAYREAWVAGVMRTGRKLRQDIDFL